MKKIYLLCFILLILGISVSAKAYEYSEYEAYGICVVSKILDYDENFDMEKTVDKDIYMDILNFWFDEKISLDTNPSNSDLIIELSCFAPKVSDKNKSITSFKDYGFIKKEHREAYKIMCNAGFINHEVEFLMPDYPLTYKTFFELLMYFEDDFIYKNGFDISEGIVTDSYADGDEIVLKKDRDEIRFNRVHTFYVQTEDNIEVYSYNIKRGNKVKFYLYEGSIVFAAVKGESDSFKKNYDITNAKIYLCNPYENKIIFVNNQNGNYAVYSYDKDLLIYKNQNKIKYDDINNYYTDLNCYIITEKNSNKIKYINITG